MSTTAPNTGQPWQPAPQYDESQYAQTQYAQPQYAQSQYAQPSAPRQKESHGSVLHRWPTWAQNTALAVGAAALLVIVFFAGYFTAHAVDNGPRGGFGTGQNFSPRQFGGNGFGGQSGNGFGGQSGNGSGGQSGSGSGSQSGSGNGS